VAWVQAGTVLERLVVNPSVVKMAPGGASKESGKETPLCPMVLVNCLRQNLLGVFQDPFGHLDVA
jgi:hypothetical protein